MENGTNPDLEVGRFLTEKHFPNIPALAGWLEYVRRNGERLTVGILTEYLPNAKDAWEFTLDSLDRYFERIRAIPSERRILPAVPGWEGSWREKGPPEIVVSLVGTYIESARLLGQRTGELHIALSSETENRDFTPEAFSPFYQRALFQSLRNLVVQNFSVLRRQLDKLPAATQALAQQALQGEHEIIRRLRSVYETRLPAKRIHCHGDFHLGQVLYTGRDFIIIDFEGEPTRSLGERRIKRSPLQDVAGMIRSFDYASHVALAKQLEVGVLHEDNLPHVEPWAAFWYRWSSEAYLRSYLDVVQDTGLLPRSFHDAKVLLDAHMLGKLAYEVGYELNNRPAWVRIPLLGLLRLLKLPREEELAFSH